MHHSAARVVSGLLALALVAAPLTAEARTGRTKAAERRPAARSLHVGALGVIPVRGRNTGAAVTAETPADQKLEYHGGPVMLSSTTYTIFWEPTTCGSGPCYVDPVYNAGIDQYLTDAAADSGTTGNVYSTLDQYYMIKNGQRLHVQYQQTFGGTYLDTNPFPATNGCVPQVGTSGVCLSDKQIRKEIQRVMTLQGWTGGKTHAFFLMLPSQVDTCYNASNCAFKVFCAYHSAFPLANGTPAIYANIPYAGTKPRKCGSGLTPPNNADLDATLNALSHEHREMTNDPLGNAWWDDQSGNEGSDQCAYQFGTTQSPGGPNNGDYNQVINLNDYLLQMEWSNKSLACKQSGY